MGSTQSESHFEQSTESTPVPGALLVFSGSAPQLRAIPLPPNVTVVLGREDAGGAALPDERASRHHCELTFDGHAFLVKDLGSRNGTAVNGAELKDPATAVTAAPGSVLRLAQSLFLLCSDVRKFQAATVTTGEHVIGPAYRAVLDQIALGARNGESVLVIGENGSGKELAAHTFHEAAAKSGPFVALNCAGIPAALAESLLFGSVKGSYSDAKDTRGHFREAHGGVLFLDELGELDLTVQAKLLRAVEHHEVLAVGASSYVPVNVRVFSATHRDLRAAVEAGTFREDLYYRLAKYQVRLPPLRERREEIPWLIQHALGALTAHPLLVELALLRPWPGNVRELVSQVKKAATNARAANSAVVRHLHLDDTAGRPTGSHPALPSRLRGVGDQTMPASPAAPPTQLPMDDVVAALKAHAWNVAATARTLKLHRTQLVRLMKKYGIAPQASDEGEPGPDAGSL